jgi:uncharacterized membrane protein (DUF373 family)
MLFSKIQKRFEQVIVYSLIGMMMVAILLSTIELGVIIVHEMIKPPFLLLNIKEMLEIFGFFMMVLIGVELLETLKAYVEKNIIHVEVVLLVAIIAVSRKVIILDYKKVTYQMMFGIAAITIALAVGYLAVRRGIQLRRRKTVEEAEKEKARKQETKQ